MNFWKSVFSESGQGSYARIAAAFHTVAAIGWGTHFVLHVHMLPDIATLSGLAAFATAPYTVGKVSSAWGKNSIVPVAPEQPHQ